MGIEWSKHYCSENYRWQIDDSTFQVLDEDSGKWLARVTTTLPPEIAAEDPNLPIEESFFVLVYSGVEYVRFENKHISILCDWCLKQTRKES